MSWDHRRRVVVAVCAVLGAAALSILPGTDVAHGATHGSARGPVRWALPLSGGAWGVAADARGAVVVVDDGAVVAVTPTGHTRWTAPALDVTEAAPALDGATVLVGGEAGITALDRARGAVRWRASMGAEVPAVALAGDVALAGTDSGVLAAFDARTGEAKWSVTGPGELWSAPRVDVVTGAVVATWHGGDAPHVEVLDLATGDARWSAPIGRAAAAPTIAGAGAAAVVIVASGDDHHTAVVEAHDLGSGVVRWRTAVPASFERAIEPAAGRHGIVVVDHFGTVTALDLAGRVRWQRPLGAPVLATRISLTRSRVVLITHEGTVTVLGRVDGRRVAATDRHRLGGYPVDGVPVRWGGVPGWAHRPAAEQRRAGPRPGPMRAGGHAATRP